jgi:hypothetical protein
MKTEQSVNCEASGSLALATPSPPPNPDQTVLRDPGVALGASQHDLGKAYRKAATKNHPDKGGDPEPADLSSFRTDLFFR